MTRPGAFLTNLRIRWANARYLIYEATHAPATDAEGLTKQDREDIEFFHDAVLAKRADQAAKVQHTYLQTWQGRLHDPECACRLYGSLGPAEHSGTSA